MVGTNSPTHNTDGYVSGWAVLLPMPQHFVLWMPLRLTHHHDSQDRPLIVANFDNYQGPNGSRDDKIFVHDHVKQTAGLLPMLHHLETVEVCCIDTENVIRHVSSVQLEANVSRCLRPNDMMPGKRAPLGGKVNTKEKSETSYVFAGVTELLNNNAVQTFSKSEFWPSGLRVQDGLLVSEKEKAPPHVGVFWCRWPAEGTARLDCSWAVYLPLSDEPEPVDLKGEWSYSLLLHGWFFVDSGRKLFRLSSKSESQAVDESSLRSEWNRELMNSGTLPLIPPSLFEFQSRAGMNPEQMRQLISGLTKTKLFDNNRAVICSFNQWGYRWGPGGANWTLIEANVPLYEIPDPKEGVNPADALPGLKKIADRMALMPCGWPH